jgi:hypothetical protein
MILCIIVEQKCFDTVDARYKHEDYQSAIFSFTPINLSNASSFLFLCCFIMGTKNRWVFDIIVPRYVQRNSTRTDGVGRATPRARLVMGPRRQDALPVHHHLFCRTLSAWLCAMMGHTWSRVYAHLVYTPVNAACPVSTAHPVFPAFICRVANAVPPVLLGKGTLLEAAGL